VAAEDSGVVVGLDHPRASHGQLARSGEQGDQRNPIVVLILVFALAHPTLEPHRPFEHALPGRGLRGQAQPLKPVTDRVVEIVARQVMDREAQVDIPSVFIR
jgi:hypothetical protein